jgi:hypothetical protein
VIVTDDGVDGILGAGAARLLHPFRDALRGSHCGTSLPFAIIAFSQASE